MKTPNRIEVRYGPTQDSVRNGQCTDCVERETIREAQRYARYCLTPEWQAANESSTPQGYAAVYVNGECHMDYFSKAESARITAAHEADETAIEASLAGNGDIGAGLDW